jgi:hypothetical protein
VGHFFTKEFDTRQTIISWRRTMAEQGLFYMDHKKEIIDQYAGKYILLQMGEVRWADPIGHIGVSRRQLAAEHPEQSLWLKYVSPEEDECEHFEVYQQTLDQIQQIK